jgi:endo-1,4-beta-xylanase
MVLLNWTLNKPHAHRRRSPPYGRLHGLGYRAIRLQGVKKMPFKRWILVFAAALLISGVSLSAAQGTSNALRDLAARSDFYVGAAVYTYHLNDPVDRDTLSREFNMLTPENEAKMCEVQPQQGKFTFDKFDRLVAFAEQNKMVVHGHTLVWHQCSPDWLNSGKFSREEAIDLLRTHITTVVGRYKGRVAIWDVVNEAIGDNGLRDTPWRRLIGDDYVELAFQYAHEADPNALLFYNDYAAEGLGAKSDAVYALVKNFVKRGIPINGVGLQTHIAVGDTGAGGRLAPELLAQNIQRLGELGLQVQITEMDVAFKGKPTEDILRRQAADYRRVLDTCLKSKYCTAFIVWGVSDKFTWLRDPRYYDNPDVAPLLFDDSYKPKPAYVAVQDLLARHAGLPPILTDQEVAALLKEGSASTVEVPKPSKSDPAQLAPDSVHGAVYYAPFPVSIKLDGDTADWKNVPRVTIDSGPTLPPNNDTKMTFAAAADTTNLYFLAEVKDSKLVYGKHPPASEWYKEDSVEFYINATGDLTLKAYKKGVSQIGILAANITHPDKPIIGGYNSADAQVSVFAVKTEDGYRVEAAVPLTTKVWSIQPKHLGVLGFQVHLNGASGDDRDTKLIWSVYDTQDQSWTNPSLFGQLIFWDVTQQP